MTTKSDQTGDRLRRFSEQFWKKKKKTKNWKERQQQQKQEQQQITNKSECICIYGFVAVFASTYIIRLLY